LLALLRDRVDRSAWARGLSKRGFTSPAAALFGAGSSAVALNITLANLARLIELPPDRRFLLDQAWSLVRIGSLDATLGFALDPLGAGMALVATGLGTWLSLSAARRTTLAPGRLAAKLALLVGALVTVFLADGFATLLLGWGVAALAMYLIGSARAEEGAPAAGTRGFVLGQLGDVGLVCGMALLFWGLGGGWPEDGRYLGDYRERFAAVHADGRIPPEIAQGDDDDDDDDEEAREIRDAKIIAQRMGKRGYLTLTAYPGAKVYLGISDAGQLAGGPPPFAVSPFVRKEIPVGAHGLVIVPGGGATVSGDGNEAAWIERMVVEEGEEVVIALVGPTLRFHEVRDQLVMRDEAGKTALAEALQGRKGAGALGLVGLSCVLLFVGAAGLRAQVPFGTWLPGAAGSIPGPGSAMAHAATALMGPFLIARLGFLFAQAPAAGTVVMGIGGVTAVVAAAMGVLQAERRKLLSYGVVALVGVAFVVAGAGKAEAAAVLAGVTAVAGAIALHGAGEERVAWAERAGKLGAARFARAGWDGGATEVVVEGVTAIARAVAWLFARIDDVVLEGPARLLSKREDRKPKEEGEPASRQTGAS
jgi:NADH-quinone oxidoreductase subunit L